MEIEYVVIWMVRLGLLILSTFLLPRQLMQAKVAWDNRNKKQFNRAVSYVWGAILFGLIAIQNLKG
ncbi:MAG: hypothetical protein ACD_17C00217G0002 [uncultured bacterium]|uniref:Uncharacterized protein n=1 Tax=Candidatus Terrybacteria bacterium RIFCSPLOWO2_02_42_20 TaxID=1802370 RepID=A0A1G2Q1A3_9BACT|nr:MAG: hypothetical protein ACD_17C00217G0002 [uncultured bacterium]OGN56521.1 MAG: hypothetical protein A2796_07225 [Chlamydiae bacterium RIFCSPHIGHO2_01_FULL_44_39]OGN56598.1 MAG: hypothetical protein A3C42_05370 [Chlamydiae bacterium RIFCSPHIGHO2_02_FULL_45_9]OGN61025.1 MAG: hypothetical protein A3D96_02875 [Chlamydiae bacterium RIFCSPHIGHO2_12_FULL_44_59]OGN66801.1 MAG: hypothetical protein A2978_00360 [Chlamydiae bacterium RIFCSPLOWO2_01_FULL_44_52]OGN69995.1 MAG: hypothetical protein A3